MADIEITVDSGTSKRLLTAGKYCDKNIMVTATGGGDEPEPPDDGKTRLYITVPANSIPDRPPILNQAHLYMKQTVDRGVTIDWGDGSKPETLQGIGDVNTIHTYGQAGDYVIELEPLGDCIVELGGKNSLEQMLGNLTRLIYKMIIARNTKIRAPISLSSYSIREIKFTKDSNQMPDFPDQLLNSAPILSIDIPEGVTSIGAYTFANTNTLCNCKLPNSLEEIGASAFRNSGVLSIEIPELVSSIGDYVFSFSSLMELYLRPKSPPIIGANTLDGLSSKSIIYVPVGSLEAYQAATNWSEYASQMQEEPA